MSEEPLDCCPQLGGNNIKCCCVKVVVHLCRHLGLQFDPIEQIPCALHLCSWKNQPALFLFLKAGQKVSWRQFVPLHSALYLLVSGSYCRHYVSSAMMMEEHHVSSLLAVYTRSAQIVEQSSSCSQWVRLCGMSPAFSFLLPRSSCKILWQAVLLMYRSSENIRTVIWQFRFKRSRNRSTFLGVGMADKRSDLATSSVVSTLSRKHLCHWNTRARDNASTPYTCCIKL